MKDASLRPAAARAKLHIADDGLERVIPREPRELCVVERTRTTDSLLDDLHLGVGLWHDVVAERIGPRGCGPRLIISDQLRDTRVHHLRYRKPVLIVDDAVQDRPELDLH